MATGDFPREFEEVTLPGVDEGEILVIRSQRRKKSISAYRQGGRIVISIPARLSKADERAIVPDMIAKIRSQEESKTPGEADLIARIDRLLTELAPEITERPPLPTSVLANPYTYTCSHTRAGAVSRG